MGMDILAHYRSITAELEALKNRVRNFIGSSHWLTDGEWKEGVLRATVGRQLPDSIQIGHGFVLTNQGLTTQCDILLYRSDRPVLFREADLVILTPDALLAIVEVKTKATKDILDKSVSKLTEIGRKLSSHSVRSCLGFFAYESESPPDPWYSEVLPKRCLSRPTVVNLINIGCSSFVRWWDQDPVTHGSPYAQWHSYNLVDMSAGYFIANLIEHALPPNQGLDSRFWYPSDPKEPYCVAKISPGANYSGLPQR
jgi:hypothetical protein